MTYGLIEGDAIARRAVAREGLTTIPTPFGRYGALPALALVPLAAPVVVPLTAEAMGILATMGLAGAGMSMMRPSSVSAIGPFESTPNWHQDSKAWSMEMDRLSKAFRKNKGGGGGIGDDCAWMLSPKTIMAKVAQEANKIALASGRPPQDSASTISKILAAARTDWLSTMTNSPTWWSKALKLAGISVDTGFSKLTMPLKAATGYSLALNGLMTTAGYSDFSGYIVEATIRVTQLLAQCVKLQKKSMGRYLGDLFGKAFGAVIYGASKLITALVRSVTQPIKYLLPGVSASLIMGAIEDYTEDNKLDDSLLAKVWDLLDRTVRDAVGADPADESGEPVTWRIPVEQSY
jgi:hypothetical protein